jgi:hypothetical protein
MTTGIYLRSLRTFAFFAFYLGSQPLQRPASVGGKAKRKRKKRKGPQRTQMQQGAFAYLATPRKPERRGFPLAPA